MYDQYTTPSGGVLNKNNVCHLPGLSRRDLLLIVWDHLRPDSVEKVIGMMMNQGGEGRELANRLKDWMKTYHNFLINKQTFSS